MPARIDLRFFQNARVAFRGATSPFRRPAARTRRYQSTEAAASASQSQTVFQKVWKSPVGPKTVHFWAPVMKWILVLAGLSDLSRPADKLSVTQNVALMATGAIWTRWCLIIKPKNVLLATVNFFVGCVGATQVTRIVLYRRSLRDSAKPAAGDTTAPEAKDV